MCFRVTWNENLVVVNKRGQEKSFLLECSWVGGRRVGEEGQWCQENISGADDCYSDGEMSCSIPRLAPKV